VNAIDISMIKKTLLQAGGLRMLSINGITVITVVVLRSFETSLK